MMSMTRDSSNKATTMMTTASTTINPTTWVTPISTTDRNLSEGRIIQHPLSPPPFMKRSSTLSSSSCSSPSPLSRRSSSSTNCKQQSSSFADSFTKRCTLVASNKSKDILPAEVFFPLEFDNEDTNENNINKENASNDATPFSLPTLTRRPNKKLRSLMLVINENENDSENDGGDYDRSQNPRLRFHDTTRPSIFIANFLR